MKWIGHISHVNCEATYSNKIFAYEIDHINNAWSYQFAVWAVLIGLLKSTSTRVIWCQSIRSIVLESPLTIQFKYRRIRCLSCVNILVRDGELAHMFLRFVDENVNGLIWTLLLFSTSKEWWKLFAWKKGRATGCLWVATESLRLWFLEDEYLTFPLTW